MVVNDKIILGVLKDNGNGEFISHLGVGWETVGYIKSYVWVKYKVSNTGIQ